MAWFSVRRYLEFAEEPGRRAQVKHAQTREVGVDERIGFEANDLFDPGSHCAAAITMRPSPHHCSG